MVMMVVRGTLRISWWRRKANNRHDCQVRVAPLWGRYCIPCRPEWRTPLHLPGSSLGHCRQTASPAPNSSWIPHKSEGSGGERKENRNSWISPASTWERQWLGAPSYANSQIRWEKHKHEQQVLPCSSLLGSLQSKFPLCFLECIFTALWRKNANKVQPKTMSIAAEILPGGCYYQVKRHLCKAKSKRRVVTGQSSVWGPTLSIRSNDSPMITPLRFSMNKGRKVALQPA